MQNPELLVVPLFHLCRGLNRISVKVILVLWSISALQLFRHQNVNTPFTRGSSRGCLRFYTRFTFWLRLIRFLRHLRGRLYLEFSAVKCESCVMIGVVEQKSCLDETRNWPVCWRSSATPTRRSCKATTAPTSTASCGCCASHCRRRPPPPRACRWSAPAQVPGPSPPHRRSSELRRRSTAGKTSSTKSTIFCTKSRTDFTSPASPCSAFSFSRWAPFQTFRSVRFIRPWVNEWAVS